MRRKHLRFHVFNERKAFGQAAFSACVCAPFATLTLADICKIDRIFSIQWHIDSLAVTLDGSSLNNAAPAYLTHNRTSVPAKNAGDLCRPFPVSLQSFNDLPFRFVEVLVLSHFCGMLFLAHERASLLDFVLQRYLTGSPLIELLLLHLFFQSADDSFRRKHSSPGG